MNTNKETADLPKSRKILLQELLHLDIPLIMAELVSLEAIVKDIPWSDEPFTFKPYCIFVRKEGQIYFYYDKEGLAWKIEKAGLFDENIIAEKALAGYDKVKDIIENERVLDRNYFFNFIKTLKTHWTWWDAMWWAIEYRDQHKLPVEKLMSVRKATEYLMPGIKTVAQKTLKNLLPEYIAYIDVISIEEVESGKIPPISELEKRLKSFVYTNEKIYTNESEVERAFNVQFEHETIETGDILKGQTAFPGKVNGKAFIMSKAEQINKFQDGQILVASTTTPDFLPAMKRAGGIISEHGGVICHAAITSRELKIPCVVGVKGATQVIKKGDLVEVDADNGVIRVIEH
jgi:phosphohistidine swiveling domain-containing protein